jgi:5'-3' exonuclease
MLKKKIAVIDADSIAYILAYSMYKKSPDKDPLKKGLYQSEVRGNVDQFVNGILSRTEADEYLGYFGSPGGKPCFRYDVAKTVAYKHTRKPKEEWFKKYQPIILDQLESFWKFEGVEGYEADDYVCQAASKYRDEGHDVIVAAIDKDIRQLTGVKHYCYNPTSNVSKEIETQTDAEAYFQLYSLMIEGDYSDGYKGITGVGKAKAREILKDCTTLEEFEQATKDAYKYWFTEGLLEKAIKKSSKEICDEWKNSNPGNRLTKPIKEKILAEANSIFDEVRDVMINSKHWEVRYKEMFKLAKLPDKGDFREEIIIVKPFVNKNKKKVVRSAPVTVDLKTLLNKIV